MRFLFIEHRRYILVIGTGGLGGSPQFKQEEIVMKVWSKPAVREQEVGLEVTSYMPAEIDII
jgi:coenzyme PQQ precursor peptide PqqA